MSQYYDTDKKVKYCMESVFTKNKIDYEAVMCKEVSPQRQTDYKVKHCETKQCKRKKTVVNTKWKYVSKKMHILYNEIMCDQNLQRQTMKLNTVSKLFKQKEIDVEINSVTKCLHKET